MLQEKDALVVHWAMHAGDDEAVLSDGTVVSIERAKNGCSSCRVAGYNFMEQNKTKTSKWARMARQGRKITWIITSPRWGRIMDDKIVQQPYPALLKSEQPSSSASTTATVTTTTVATSSTQTSTQQATKEVTSKLKRHHEDLFDSKKDETIELKKQKLETRTYTLEVGFPQHWSTPFNKVQQVELFRGDDEYEKISHLMQTTISDLHKSRYGYRSFAVRKIFRLQHPSLWGHYYLRKQEVIRCNDAKPEDIVGVKTGNPIDPEANEYYLFHGLNHKIVDKICESGFDERVSNLAGMFGCGIYFAEDSSKSSQYSHTATCAQVGAVYAGQSNACSCYNDLDGERCMFLCRVTMGTPWVRLAATNKDQPLRRPPDRDGGLLYDSVLGESRAWQRDAALDFREFIVYDRRQCYPEYLVYYHRVA